MTRYTIKELPVLERPYEKLEMYGEKALSNAELLAIILKTGTKEETAVQLAQRVLNECCATNDSLSLRDISINTLKNIKGIGRVKAIVLKAAFELANRIDTKVIEKPFLYSSKLAGEYALNVLRNEKQEKLKIFGLDSKGKLERDKTVLIGSIYKIDVAPSDIFRMPIECGCKYIIMAHNHPTGDPTPSPEDIKMTEKLKDLGKALEIELVDHIVVGDGKYVSIRKLNKIKW